MWKGPLRKKTPNLNIGILDLQLFLFTAKEKKGEKNAKHSKKVQKACSYTFNAKRNE